ncbi:MAG: hypothetical protein MUO26_10840 [Methanotrichaceae archaeon]|nr:hypothetical protein [Methanotrichaceae archaeon]
MRKKVIPLLLLLSAMVAPCFGSINGNVTEKLEPEIVGQVNQTDRVITPAEASLLLQLRTLWQEHIFWTRMAIMTIIQNSGDKDPVIARLLRNYEDMAETVQPYLGNESAKNYGDLIEEHLIIAAELVETAKDGNETALEDVNSRWFKNADEIASFENKTIPVLTLEMREAMWHEHLNLTKNQTQQLLAKDFNASIDTFDRIEEQSNMMADSLAEGIIQQFPEKFH